MFEMDNCSNLFPHRSIPERLYRRKIIPKSKLFRYLTLFSLLGKRGSLRIGSELIHGPWPGDQALEGIHLGINDKTVEKDMRMHLLEWSRV